MKPFTNGLLTGLVVPLQDCRIKKGDVKTLDLSYEMGGGMLTIKHKLL
jgi:hypothetical protein